MTKRNRGKQSSDDIWFGQKWLASFKEAADDVGFLLSRGYAHNSVLQIVGNRYKLNKRQRSALFRIGASDQEIAGRNKSSCSAKDLKNKTVEIDGFNILILLESTLSGGFVFKARDGLYRDISSVHGSYKRVMKTEEAILLIGKTLKSLSIQSAKWYLDQPVSNSGRLKTRLMEISRENDYNWEVDLVFNPDKVLAESEYIAISSDGWILDRKDKWFNLGAYILEGELAEITNVIEV